MNPGAPPLIEREKLDISIFRRSDTAEARMPGKH